MQILNLSTEYNLTLFNFKFLFFSTESNRTFPGDNFVEHAINQATHQVNSAINETLTRLFDRSRTHSVSDLLQIFRYPSAEALELARAEEVFEHTLEIIHRHVAEGHRYNLEGHGKPSSN